MIFISQKSAIEDLHLLSTANRQSVLIEGCVGSGKTYLARQYANMLGVSDFITVAPKVDDIKSAVDSCLSIQTGVVVCIENLDVGVPASSYCILKFLEEPTPNVFIVITCRNIKKVPDTIISRSAVVSVCPPTSRDLVEYAREKDITKYGIASDTIVWSAVRTYSDCDVVLDMPLAKLQYFNNLKERVNLRDSISTIVWNMSHFDDNSDVPLELVIRCLMDTYPTPFVRSCGVSCIGDLNSGRVAKHAVLSKFAFNLKYCE